jgi:hypothetical protein
MFSPEEVARREEERLREQQLATLGLLSGDKPLQAVSAPLLRKALEAGETKITDHGEYSPREGKLRVFPEYLRRLEENRLAADLGRAETGRDSADFRASESTKAQDARAALQASQAEILAPYRDATLKLREEMAKLTALRTKLAAQKAGRGEDLKGQAYKDMKKAGEDLDELDLIETKLTKEFSGGTAQGLTFLGKTQDAITSQFPGFVPDQWMKNREAWATLQRLGEMKKRYALFGATLTGNEKSSWEAVTPPRGLSGVDLVKWFDTQKTLVHRAIGKNAEALAEGGANKNQLETFTRGLYKAPQKKKVQMWDPTTNSFTEVEE